MNISFAMPSDGEVAVEYLSEVSDLAGQVGGVRPIEAGKLGPFCVLRDGSLGAFFFEGKAMSEWADDTIPQYMCFRRSIDKGDTWSEPRVVFQFPPMRGAVKITDLDLIPFVDREGTVHIYCFNALNWDVEVPYQERVLELLHLYSKDNGGTWEGPVKIDYGHRYTGSLNAITQLSTGRVVLPFSYLHNGNTFVCTAIISDDDGYTWRKSRKDVYQEEDPALHLESGAMEPVTIEMSDGRVWMVIRTTTGRLFESWSEDGGETWSTAAATAFRSSNAPAALLPLANGEMLMVWNHCKGEPFANGVSYARQSLVAAIRKNDGSWHGFREVARLKAGDHPDHSVCYPWLIDLGKGNILLGYLDVHLARWKETIRFRAARFDLDWVASQSALAQLSLGSGDLSVTASGVHSINGTVSLARAEADEPAAITWNFPWANKGEVRLRMRIADAFRGAAITLAETFLKPSNLQEGLFRLRVEPDGRIFVQYANERAYEYLHGSPTLPLGEWFDLGVSWNGDRSSATVFVDGRAAGTLPQLEAGEGASFIRIAALGTAGLEIKEISSEVCA